MTMTDDDVEQDPGTVAVPVFRASTATDDTAPHRFAIEAEDAEGEPVEHQFAARGRFGAQTSLAIGAILRYDENGKSVIDLNALTRFFRQALLPEDWRRMEALLNDPDQFVDMEALADAFVWLVERYTGRPFGQSRSSRRSPPSNGRPSTAKRPSRART